MPEVRVREANKAQRNPEGDYVPYWITAYRRLGWNHALQHAAELAGSMGKPLVILEVLLVDYPYASPRLHRFMLERMAEWARMLSGRPERSRQPTTSAGFFRRISPTDNFGDIPRADPLSGPLRGADGALDSRILEKWAPASGPLQESDLSALEGLARDRRVIPVDYPGGTSPARARLARFLDDVLPRYHADRNHPDFDATSGLSPYLHFGNLSVHEIFSEISSREGWSPLRISPKADGSRSGWWGMGEGAEAFLDQLVTWRELGFNFTSRREDYAAYESLPDWARNTLEEHEADPRPHLYSHQDFQEARTHDPLWNAAQRQLLEEGIIHSYLRMLWGKKILEWSASPREALGIMLDLNDRFALDGRDPNSYSGIFWCLGRYDRGWPERSVFGKVRSMSSERTRKKVKLEGYLERFGPP